MNGAQPALAVAVVATPPLANSECVPEWRVIWPRPLRISISPVMWASRIDVDTSVPARLTWSSSVDRRYSPGPAAANGRTGTANPATTPSAYPQVRRRLTVPAGVGVTTQTTSSARAGSTAQYFTAPATPIATPAQNSRCGELSRPRRKAAQTPISSSRFIHGSRMSVCAVVMSSGYAARMPQLTTVTNTPRQRTRDPTSGTHRAEASTVSSRAAAIACVAVDTLAMTATGAISSRMPGGWTNAKPWYGTLPEISRIAPPRYTPSSYSVTPVRKSGLLSMNSRRASESPVAARMTSPAGDSQYARSTSGRNQRGQ